MDFTREETELAVRLALALNRAVIDVVGSGEEGVAPVHTHVISYGFVLAIRELNDLNATEVKPHPVSRFVAENLARKRLNEAFGQPGT